MQPTLDHPMPAVNRQTGARNGPLGFKRYCFALAAIAPLTPIIGQAANAHEYVKPAQWFAARTAIGRWAGLSQAADLQISRPSDTALAAGRRFIREAEMHRISEPTPYIDDDGEFGFRWQTPKGFGSVAFMPDGNLVVYAHEEGSEFPPLELDEPIGNCEAFAGVIARISHFA